MVLLGSAADKSNAERLLGESIRVATGVVPSVEIVAVPDRAAFDRLVADSKPRPSVPTARPVDSRERLRDALERHWPAGTAGSLQAASIAAAGSPIEVVVVHVGPRLAPDALETIERSLQSAANEQVKLIDVALSPEHLTLDQGEAAFAIRLGALMEASRRAAGVWICVEAPERPDGGYTPDSLRAEIERLAATHPRVTWIAGSRWHAQASIGPCGGAVDAGVELDSGVDAPED